MLLVIILKGLGLMVLMLLAKFLMQLAIAQLSILLGPYLGLIAMLENSLIAFLKVLNFLLYFFHQLLHVQCHKIKVFNLILMIAMTVSRD